MIWPLEPRFEARKDSRGWGVFDRWLASWPVRRPELGTVAQETTRVAAEADASRCNAVVREQRSSERRDRDRNH